MGLSITVEVSKMAAEAPLELERRARSLAGPGLHKQIGRGVANLFAQHFFRLDGERANKLRGDRTHFYGDAAKATSSEGDAAGATVTVAQLGIRQRLEGGTIRPRAGKYLTIPARAEAYGRSARDFRGLQFVPLGHGRGMLVAKEDLRIRGGKKFAKSNEGLALFWLVPSVVQRPDPSVLPREAVIRGVVVGVVDRAWQRAEKRGMTSDV